MKSLRNELILSFVVVIAVAVGPLIAFSYAITEELLESRLSKATVDMLGQLGNGLNMILSDTQDLSLFTISDHNVRNYLKTNATEPGIDMEFYLARLNETFTSLINYKPYITAISIYGVNGLRFETAGYSNVTSESYQETSLPESGRFIISPPYRRYYSTAGEQYILSFSRQINDINALGTKLGSLRFDINEAEIYKLYRNIMVGNEGSIFIVGTDGVILSHRDKSMLAQNVLDDELLASAFQGGAGITEKQPLANE